MKTLAHKLIGVAFAAFCAAELGAPSAAAAADAGSQVIKAENGFSKRITLGLGKSMIVDLPVDAGEIFVANPTVANAVVRSARKIYVIGQSTGQTTIFAMDRQGERVATIDLAVGRDITELERILKVAMPNSMITAHMVDDSVVLTGQADSAADVATALEIGKTFAENVDKAAGKSGGAASAGLVINAMTIRERDQVMVKVTIAEIQRTIAKQLGISSSTLTAKWGSLTQTNPFALNGSNLSNSGVSVSGSYGGYNLAATLSAFERNGVSRILAEPTVSAVSGESAKFTVGGEIPISAGSTCTTSTGGAVACTPAVTFKTYGVTLNFTPLVLSQGRIQLRVATEVAEIDPSTSITYAGASIPGFRTRKHETTVELPSGGSIASAGLIQTTSNQAINGLPGLMNLPILGTLFRSRDYQRQETELVIIVTPYIAKPVAPSALARPDDGFSDANDPQAWLLGKVNKLYSSTDNPEAMQHFNGRVGFIHD